MRPCRRGRDTAPVTSPGTTGRSGPAEPVAGPEHPVRLQAGLLATLGALSAFAPISLDLYLPAFPSIGASLGVTAGDVQLTFSACLAGLGLGQLVYGPLSDRYGRKPPLLAGLVLFVVASVLCALAPSLATLTALRLLQGLGGCAGIVIARAVVRDCFSGPVLARAFSVVAMVSMLAPMLAPPLGALLLRWASWRFLFVVLAAFGFACLLTSVRLAETHPHHHRTDHGARQAVREYVAIGTQRQFVVPAAIGALGAATLFAYIGAAPAVFMAEHGVSAQAFALLFAGFSVCSVAGSQLNLRLAYRHDARTLLRAYLLVQVPSLVLLVLLTVAGAPLGAVVADLVVVHVCIGAIFPSSMAETMRPYARRAGSAAALMGTAQMVSGAVAAAVLAGLSFSPDVEMAGLMLLTAALGLALAALRAPTRPEPVAA